MHGIAQHEKFQAESIRGNGVLQGKPAVLKKPEILAAVKEQLDERGITPERVKCVLGEILFGGESLV